MPSVLSASISLSAVYIVLFVNSLFASFALTVVSTLKVYIRFIVGCFLGVALLEVRHPLSVSIGVE